jgi:hypothetical protein
LVLRCSKVYMIPVVHIQYKENYVVVAEADYVACIRVLCAVYSGSDCCLY